VARVTIGRAKLAVLAAGAAVVVGGGTVAALTLPAGGTGGPGPRIAPAGSTSGSTSGGADTTLPCPRWPVCCPEPTAPTCTPDAVPTLAPVGTTREETRTAPEP
jgi:hypothetical protein